MVYENSLNFDFYFQSENGTAKHFLQIIDNAESDYQVFLAVICILFFYFQFYNKCDGSKTLVPLSGDVFFSVC